MTALPSLQEIASCVAGYDPKALPVAQAQEFIARLVPRVQAVERVALRSALGRILAEDVVSAIDVPSHDNSAMDGFALRGSELGEGAEVAFKVAGAGFAANWFFILARRVNPARAVMRETVVSTSHNECV